MNNYFLQFANNMKINGENYLALGNGFSDTWDLCKQQGDFIWFKQDNTNKISSENISQCIKTKCPVENGTVYASAINIMNLFQIYTWARRYKNVKFIVGGPTICTDLFKLTSSLPDNMILTKQTVENHFCVPDFSYDWKLETPSFASEGIAFAYTLDTVCYWGKCIFCGPHSSCVKRQRPNINFEFQDVNYDGKILVRLNSPSISPSQILTLKNLPDDDRFEYSLLMRGCDPEIDAMKELVTNTNGQHKFYIGIGIEFPSDRMYSYMNKGLNLKTISKNIIKLTEMQNVTVILTSILGWENLIEDDLKELDGFLEDVVNKSVSKLIIHKLKYPHTREIHGSGSHPNEISVGPFYLGYIPELNSKQQELNMKANDMLMKFERVVNHYA